MTPLKHETLVPEQVADIVNLVRNTDRGATIAMQRYGLRKDQLIDPLQEQGIRGKDWFDAN